MIGNYLSRHGLACSALAREKSVDTQAASSFRCKAPLFVDRVTMSDLARNLSQQAQLSFRQDDVVPGCLRLDVLGQHVESWARRRQARVPNVIGMNCATVGTALHDLVNAG